jgi:hypothetical protein
MCAAERYSMRSVQVRKLALLEVPLLSVGVLPAALQGLDAVLALLLPLQELLHASLLQQGHVLLAAPLPPYVLDVERGTILGVKVRCATPSLFFSHCFTFVSLSTFLCQSMFFW